MESARVRGTHLPPEESRRKQPGKGAAGSQTVVETVSHSLALSLLYNPCTFISLCVHLFRAIYGKSRWYAYRCVISVVTGISRHLAPSPVDVSEQQSETNTFIYLSTPSPSGVAHTCPLYFVLFWNHIHTIDISFWPQNLCSSHFFQIDTKLWIFICWKMYWP